MTITRAGRPITATLWRVGARRKPGRGARSQTWIVIPGLVAVALSACQPAPSSDSEPWTLSAPFFEVGGLTDDERYALGDVVGGMRLDDGRVIIADRLSFGLRMFSPEGELLKQVGREGQGPGEFEYLRGMGRCGEGLVVGYQIDWRENRYDMDLEFVGTRPATIDAVGGLAYELACNEKGYVLATGWGDTGAQFEEGYYVATAPVALLRDGELVHDFGERLSSERVGAVREDGSPAGSGPHPFGRSMSLALGPSRAYLGDAADYRVEAYDLTGRRLPDIAWSGPDLSLTDEDSAALLDRLVEAAAPSDRPAERRRWRDLPVLERYPAYDRLVTDVAGNLWVRHFPRVEADSADWMVFDPAGTKLGEVRLSLRSTLLDAGPDWVLVSDLDELDVATVRVHRLVK